MPEHIYFNAKTRLFPRRCIQYSNKKKKLVKTQRKSTPSHNRERERGHIFARVARNKWLKKREKKNREIKIINISDTGRWSRYPNQREWKTQLWAKLRRNLRAISVMPHIWKSCTTKLAKNTDDYKIRLQSVGRNSISGWRVNFIPIRRNTRIRERRGLARVRVHTHTVHTVRGSTRAHATTHSEERPNVRTSSVCRREKR